MIERLGALARRSAKISSCVFTAALADVVVERARPDRRSTASSSRLAVPVTMRSASIAIGLVLSAPSVFARALQGAAGSVLPWSVYRDRPPSASALPRAGGIRGPPARRMPPPRAPPRTCSTSESAVPPVEGASRSRISIEHAFRRLAADAGNADQRIHVLISHTSRTPRRSCRKEREADFRPDARHLQQVAKQATLVIRRESVQELCIFAHDEVREQLHLLTHREAGAGRWTSALPLHSRHRPHPQ